MAQRERADKAPGKQSAAAATTGAQGVGKATSVLPYAGVIQRSFGRHDISEIRVEVGGDAADAAGTLGAQAYAFGDRIAFAAAPDLHTAAHEAAHVVQQRAGVSVPGGVGTAGDQHERHADRVADAVVAGGSAEALLDEVAPRAGAGPVASPAVQRKTGEVYVTAARYLAGHQLEFRTVIGAHLQSVSMPPGHPRLSWHDERKFYARLFTELYRLLGTFRDPEAVRAILRPHDPYEVIDEMRPIAGIEKPIGGDPLYGGKAGLITYRPTIAMALAQLFEGAIVQSLRRLGPRWLAEADTAAGGPGRAHGTALAMPSPAVAMSHHLDRAVLPALSEPGVLDVRAETKGETAQRAADGRAGKATTPTPPPGRRKLQLDWQGPHDRLMWNWVRVTSPADPTVEEVAAEVFAFAAGNYHEKDASFLAYGITAAPPFFALPATWARNLPECRAYAPADTDKDQTGHQHNLVLAGAGVTDELALIEAGRHKPAAATPGTPGAPGAPAKTVIDAGELIDDLSIQATAIKARLTPWKLGGALDRTLAFLGRKLAEIKTPADVAQWLPVLQTQKQTLKTIGAAVVTLDATATQIGIKAKSGPEAGVLHDIMMLYADAAASSHLTDTSARLVAQAGELQSRLSLAAIETTTRAMASSVDAMNETTHGPDQRAQNRAAVELQDDSKALQSRLLRGDQVTDHEVESFTLAANLVSLRAKAETVLASLRRLKTAAHDARDGAAHELAAWFSGDFRELEPATQALEQDLTFTIMAIDFDVSAETMTIRDPKEYSAARHKAYKAAYDKASSKFEAMKARAVGTKSLETWLKDGEKLIHNQELRAAIVKMAALLGISLVGGALGGAVTRMVAGVWGRFASAGLAEISFAGRMVSAGTGMTVDAAVGAAGQSAIYGEHFSGNFAEHMLTALGTHGVMSTLGNISRQMEQLKQSRRLLGEVNAIESGTSELHAVEKALEKAAPGKWKKAGTFVLSEGAKLTGHTLMGAGLSYVAHRMVSGETGAEQGEAGFSKLEEWAMQGGAVFVGRYVGHAVQHRLLGHRKLAAIPDFEPGQRLLAESVELGRMAEALSNPKQAKPAAALELLARRHRVLLDEIAALEQLAKLPVSMRRKGLTEPEIRKMQHELHDQLDEAHAQGFEEMALHLAGLEELIPGAEWKGSRANIELAVRSAERTGVRVQATRDAQSGRWTVDLNGRKLTIHEHEAPARAGTGAAGTGHALPPTGPGRGGGGGGAGGDGAPTAPADPARANRALATQAVPGSELRGLDKPLAPAKVQNQHGELLRQEAHYKMLGLTDVVPGVRSIQRSAAGPYVVTLTDGTAFGLEVMAAPLDGQTVARAIVNPTKPGRIAVYGGELDVQGRHVIQLSISMNQAQVERAIAGQLGIVAKAHSEMIRGRHDGPSALGGNGTANRIGALDTGRIAEINLLARQIRETPANAAALRRELVALVEHLGVRDGADGAAARWKLLEPELDRAARDELARARRHEGDLSAAERTELGKIREEAFDDLKGMMKQAGQANGVHPLPASLAPPGKVVDRARLAEAARMAMEYRAMVSEKTLVRYRSAAAAAPRGQYAQVADLQIGGGAALAARRPGALLVDQRGRWQADGGTEIAQTAQQIRMLREAGIGDPREVAGPGERVPLDAIRYWEDSIAAQGEVIDGAAAFRTDEHGRMLLDIRPTGGGAPLTLEVTGTPTISTGFPTERAPGAARGITSADAILMVEHRLRVIADDTSASPRVRDAARRIATRLSGLQGESIANAAVASRLLRDPALDATSAGELKQRLLDKAGDQRGAGIKDALQTFEASEGWLDAKNTDRGQQSLFLGDEANLWTIKQLVAKDNPEAPKHVIVAGTGGTAISAVEIILASNPDVKITMLGRDTPAGLAGNDQFRQVALKHLDHEDAARLGLPGGTVDERLRIVIDAKMNLGAPTAGADGHTYTGYKDPRTGSSYSGDAYIAALGRENQVPPIVSEMITQARRQGGDGAVQYKPLIDKNQRFTGYQIAITIGKRTHFVEVTGAVSRFAPRGAGSPDNAAIRGEGAARIDRAGNVDAHPNSGGFDAGYGSTADQTSAYATDRIAREAKKP